MFSRVKRKISGPQQPSLLPPEAPPPCPHSQRRAPSTPPLPLRTLQLVAKQPETPVVLRGHRKVKGHGLGVRESWPGSNPTTSAPQPRMSQRSLTPPSWDQPITETRSRSTNQPRPHMNPALLSQNSLLPAAPHPHGSVPVRPLLGGRRSEATMTSLLLLCRSGSSNSLIAIDNKIEQAMDLVKSHLMLAVREEVELLREQIRELQEKNQQLERENHILRTLTHSLHNT